MNSTRVVNNEYGIAEIQEKLLQLLDVFDSICRENNIKYSLHGGTLLGAERNHHLIPWDDDIDVSMRRKDFDYFKKAIRNNQIPEGYSLDETVLWLHRFIMNNQEASVGLDIFIWDYISENKFEQKLKITALRTIQGMMKEDADLDYTRYGFKEKVLVGVTHGIGRFFRNDRLRKVYHRVQTKMCLGSRQFIHRSNDSYQSCSYIFDGNYMDEYSEIELEGKNYMVNRRYHEFLEMSYGMNYLTPPPLKERHPYHDGI